MPVEFPAIFEASKSLVKRPQWLQRDSKRVEFAAAIMIDDVIVEGLELRGKALVEMPDRAVCFNLQYHPSKAACEPLCRIEWNPLRPHTNPLKGHETLCGQRFLCSHIHDFKDNWLEEFGRMRSKNLPFAAELNPNPASFSELLELVEERARIEGLCGMEPPPWSEGSLFGD